jgi:aminodeoxyfutalosine deaminase
VDQEVRRFLERLPKVELHLHLVGAIGPTTLGLLGDGPADGAESAPSLTSPPGVELTGEHGFLAIYREVTARIRRPEHVLALVEDAGRRLATSGVRYAEVTVTAASHLRAGIAPADLRDALDEGRRRVARERCVDLAWIVDVSGQHGAAAAWATLRWLARHPPQGTVGFGLGGPERGVPRAAYRTVFGAARSLGLRSTPHAGEHGDHRQVRAAMDDLQADRIGHGLAAVDDGPLLRELVERGVTLEVCPTSNVLTGAVRSYEQHPLPVLLDAGVPVTIGTDDPGVFGTNLLEEYRIAAQLCRLDRAALVALVLSGIDAAFCDTSRKAELRRGVEVAAAAAAAGEEPATFT